MESAWEGVGVKPGVGVAVGDTVGVGVPWLNTTRRGEISQPIRLNSNTATGKHPATILSRVSLFCITFEMMLKAPVLLARCDRKYEVMARVT